MRDGGREIIAEGRRMEGAGKGRTTDRRRECKGGPVCVSVPVVHSLQTSTALRCGRGDNHLCVYDTKRGVCVCVCVCVCACVCVCVCVHVCDATVSPSSDVLLHCWPSDEEMVKVRV